MLRIQNLSAEVGGHKIIKDLSLSIEAGEVHAIMGPNGSGKSTLAKVIAGYPDYEVTQGSIEYDINFKMKNLLELAPEERAREGIFMAFQYPTEIPGVNNQEFLRMAFNAVATHQGGEEMDAFDFEGFVKKKLSLLEMDPKFIKRELNVDFSGGEKKRNEILQMAVLSPRLSLMDETDSGLDVDSLKAAAQGVSKLRNQENAFLLITHYNRLLDYITPDHIHILHNGKIIHSGDRKLALEIEKHGYEPFIRNGK